MAMAGFARAVLMVVATAAVAACGQDNRYAAPPPPKVTVAAPVEQEVTRYFEATGNTAAVNTVDLVARVQGFVQAISYTDGEYVKKGTSLFTIEPEPYKLKVEARRRRSPAPRPTSSRLKRSSAPGRSGDEAGLDPGQLRQGAGAARFAQADLQSAQANEQQAEINLGYTNVIAPFDGVVTARQVSIGQLVGANSTTVLSTIVQLDPIYVNFTASERDVLQVRAEPRAAPARTTADCSASRSKSGCRPKAAIRIRASSTTSRRRSILRPERSRRAPTCRMPIAFCCPVISCACAIPSRPQPALLVPDVALGSDQGGRYVLVVNKDNVVEQRRVEAGPAASANCA